MIFSKQPKSRFRSLDKRSAKFQGYTRSRTDRFRQFDNKPSREMRQHALRLVPQAFSRTMDRHWTAHIALSLDALSSDMGLGFRLSQGGTFPTIDIPEVIRTLPHWHALAA